MKYKNNWEDSVSNNIIKLMEKHGINAYTTYILSALFNLKPSSVSELLDGKRRWRLEQIIKIAKYFTISLDELVFGSKDYIPHLEKTQKYETLNSIKDFLVKEKKFAAYGKLQSEGFFKKLER